MGQYRHHVFVCTSGKTCPLDGSNAVHAILEHLLGGGVVDDYRNVAPPGDNKLVEGDPAP